MQVNASSRKLSQVHASGWPNETQVERKSQTCVDLRRLASPFGQGFSWKGDYEFARIQLIVLQTSKYLF